jgi:putative ABC transport system substrate-binding protein
MKRRDFITLLGGAAAWPLAARAQQTRRVGWLSINPETAPVSRRLVAFKRGLAALGWIEGRNIMFEERWAGDDYERLRVLAAELVAMRPDLIFVGNSPSLAAIRRATGTIPILFANVADPVGQGFVSSLAQPGGNITGFAGVEFSVVSKNLELLKKISPGLARAVFMYDPAQPAAAGGFAEAEASAPSLGLEIAKAPVRNAGEIERAINALAQGPAAGLLVFAGPVITSNQGLIVTMTTQRRLPTVFGFRYSVDAGGLASYGPDDVESSRRAATYADRILRGEKPSDLPVQLETKFELVLNLKTAKAIGLIIPENVLALADDVIE